ncbi:hypothetical protein BDP55DRAFT_711094 [Colletotrichum godetiae]|uniref:Uncharacterized protein n=1 Tax=Colletotrichum godetiae TaxID=1209918 RepID=A0AAJ0AW96_9PEZI|nr:uncharacterized protein BDP55DRAFT_711094 [Colletotrichum godetiae]KAK1691485.1 hypothetical protein BDP55DRAFT_711094 [Colletotrichum godetiae]
MVGNYCADLTGERQILVSRAPSRRFKFHLIAGVVPRSVLLPDESPIPITVKPGSKEGDVSMSQVHAGRRAHHLVGWDVSIPVSSTTNTVLAARTFDLLVAGAPREPGETRMIRRSADAVWSREGRSERLTSNLSNRQAHTVLGRGGRRFCDPISLPHAPCNDSQMYGQ